MDTVPPPNIWIEIIYFYTGTIHQPIDTMKLDYSAFTKAIAQLEKSLKFLCSNMAKEDEDLREQFRAAVIQAFEYNYELATKMILRQMERIVANPAGLREMAFMDLIRSAADANLVKDVPAFSVFREKRNTTSHTYDAEKAEDVIKIIDGFLKEMKHLHEQLKQRNP